MSTLIDLGFGVAKCTIQGEDASLELFQQPIESGEASYFSVTTLASLIALRDCINDEIAAELEREEIKKLVDNPAGDA